MIDQELRVDHTSEGIRILFQGRNLYHEKAPKERAESAARQIRIEENCLVLVPSPLAGYGLKPLLDGLPNSSRILCIEADENLMRLAVSSIPESILKDPRISFIRTESSRSALVFAEKIIKSGRIRRTRKVLLNRGYGLYPEFYRRIEEEILSLIQNFWRNRMTSLHMGRLWMKNLFLNLSNLPSALPLSALSLTKPTAVVGAGESLEGALGFLSDHRDLLQIVAVDTALPVLLSAGITPDLIVVAEAQYANFYDFIGLKDWSIPAAVDLTSYHGIFRRFSGPRYVFMSRFENLSWFELDEVRPVLPPFIPPMGSVGVMAFYIASRALPPELPILLAGLDFSYPPGKPHSRGAPSHQLHLIRHDRRSYPSYLASWYLRPKKAVRNKYNEEVTVDGVISSYAEQMRVLVEERGNVYDLGGKGLSLGAKAAEYPAEILKKFVYLKKEKFRDTAGFWAPSVIDGCYSSCLKDLSSMETCLDSPERGSKFASLLERNDFLTIDFPGTPPLPVFTDDFILRCIGRARWYAEKIRQGRVNISRRRS